MLHAQGTPQEEKPSPAPQVKINYINVCAPSEDERKEIASALARVPLKAPFSADFEVSRGHTTETPESMAFAKAALPAAVQDSSQPSAESSWVRIRRDFSGTPFGTAQYSISFDPKSVTETFVFRMRDFKKDEVMQIALEDSISAASDPILVAQSETPVDHVKIERFGKGSLGLRRCPDADQSSLEPLFKSANDLAQRYRMALRVRDSVPADLRRVGAGASAKPRTAAKPKAAPKPK
ncbi:MAG: hypothetical protein ACJ71N_09885 [Terriglobales bacterium]|jgi:hypothetical protein